MKSHEVVAALRLSEEAPKIAQELGLDEQWTRVLLAWAAFAEAQTNLLLEEAGGPYFADIERFVLPEGGDLATALYPWGGDRDTEDAVQGLNGWLSMRVAVARLAWRAAGVPENFPGFEEGPYPRHKSALGGQVQ